MIDKLFLPVLVISINIYNTSFGLFLNEIKEVNLYYVFILLIERLYNGFMKMILEKTDRIIIHFFDYDPIERIFVKNNEGKYTDIDFSQLVNLSIVDYELRRRLLDMTLNIEHYAKINLVNYIGLRKAGDAY